jgi:hypothetical protein
MDSATVAVIIVVIGAILIFALALLFFPQIVRHFEQAKSISLKFIGIELEITGGDAQGILQQLLDEALLSVNRLDDTNKRLFNLVRTANGTRTVDDITQEVFGHQFERQSDEHKRFRELRDRKLIRPRDGSTWEPRKYPVLTRFVELLLRVKPDLLR